MSELRVTSAQAQGNICLKLGHLAEPSTLLGPGIASVWAQDMCLKEAQHLSGPGVTSAWPGGSVCLSSGHVSDLRMSAGLLEQYCLSMGDDLSVAAVCG